MDSWKDNKSVFWTLAGPGTFWLLVFFIVPLGYLFVMSFSDKAVVNGEISITDYDYLTGITNYIRSVDPLYLTIMWKSIWVSALATLLCLLTAYPIAFGICFAPERWKPLLLLLVILPFWINLLIRTYALIAVFRTQGYVNNALIWIDDRTYGLINTLLAIIESIANFVVSALNYIASLWGGHIDYVQVGPLPLEMLYNNFAVIFGLVYVYMPFMVLPLYATIERLDKSFLEASLDLGASQFTTFRKVTVPLTMPGIVTGIILVFIPCLGSFLTPDLLGGANAVMIGNVIERQFKAANDWPFGAALSFMLMYATFAALMLRAVLAKRSAGVDV